MERPMNPIRFLFALLPFFWSAFQTDAGDLGASEGDADGEGDQKGDKSRIEWTAEQQKEIQRIAAKEARKAADKARQEEKDRIAQEQANTETDARRKQDEEAGKFAEVRQSLESERDTIKGERDAVTRERDEYRQLIEADVTAAWDGLPEEVRDAYDGEDDDVLAKKRHMNRMAKVIAKLSGEQTGNPGNRENPKPGTNGEVTIETPLTKRQIVS
jgi:hypothetical protein